MKAQRLNITAEDYANLVEQLEMRKQDLVQALRESDALLRKNGRLERQLAQQVGKNDELRKAAAEVKPTMGLVPVEGPKWYTNKTAAPKKSNHNITLEMILSFGATRLTTEGLQTIIDLIHYAMPERDPEIDQAIQKMISDFRNAGRPQMNVKDSVQNIYLRNRDE